VTPATGFLTRLDAVVARLQAHAGTPAAGLTSADPATGDRWDPGQVWAHLAEFIPYWIDQTRTVIAAGEPVGFGRTQSDPRRLGEIARRREESPAALMETVREEAVRLRDFLAGLDDAAWARSGIHPTLGAMAVPQMIESFLVGHLEQHADQLDGLAPAS
jgi:hypothetical protein